MTGARAAAHGKASHLPIELTEPSVIRVGVLKGDRRVLGRTGNVSSSQLWVGSLLSST